MSPRDAGAAPQGLRAAPGVAESGLPPTSLRGGRRRSWRLRAGELAELPLRRRLGAHEGLVVLAADERLDAVVGDVVVDLERRALHEVARRGDERALEPAIEPQLEAADRVGDDARRVRGVPDLQFQLGVERNVAEGGPLHP